MKPITKNNLLSLGAKLLIPVLLLIAAIRFSFAFDTAAQNCKSAYNQSQSNAADAVYQAFYDKSYAFAEQRHHLTNHVDIVVESLKEEASLEVLSVTDSEVNIQKADKSNGNVESWLQVTGTGIFTVDLAQADFIADNDRQFVLVKLPKPQFSRFHLDSEEQKLLVNKNGFWKNGSYQEGYKISDSQRSECETLIKNHIRKTPRYFSAAKTSATRIVTDLIQSLNPDMPDLQICVEFFE